jgi:hypothetical protein
MTQQSKVLDHLQSRGSINSLEAITRYGITRISAVIYALKLLGHAIDTVPSERADGFREYTYNFEKAKRRITTAHVSKMQTELNSHQGARPEVVAKILTQYANKVLAVTFLGR